MLVLVFLAATALAQELILDYSVIDNESGRISARFGFEVQEVPELAEYLEDGSTLEMRCILELYRIRSLWTDAFIREVRYVDTLSYDAVADEYVLTHGDGGESLRSGDLEELLERAWGQISLDAGAWGDLARGKRHYLELTVSIKNIDIPIGLRLALFFWPWDVVPATTYRLELSG